VGTKRYGWLLIVCLLLNIADAGLTLCAISLGVVEANPLMAHALSYGPSFFLAVKISLFTLAATFLYFKRPRALAPVAIIYLMILIYHLLFWLNGL
jgi:hypothetical protein